MNLRSAIFLLVFCAFELISKVAAEKDKGGNQESFEKRILGDGEAEQILRKFKIRELYEPVRLLSDTDVVDQLRTKLILGQELRFKFPCGAYVPWKGEEFPLEISQNGKNFQLNSVKLLTESSPFEVLSTEVLGGESSCEITYKNSSDSIALRLVHHKMPLEERIISRLRDSDVNSNSDVTLEAFFNEKKIEFFDDLPSNARFIDVKTLQNLWEKSDRAVTQSIAKKNARVWKIVRGTVAAVFVGMYALIITMVPSYNDILFRAKDVLTPETFYLWSAVGTSFISACISCIFYLWYPPLHKYFSKI